MFAFVGRLERETGIEPATNSLEGCDSTTELLPPTRRVASRRRRFGEAGPLFFKSQIPNPESRLYRSGGEGRTRTFEAARATDLQSAAFDRFATSPIVCIECEFERSPQKRSAMELAKGFEPPTC
jgi:hypothetical protein